MIGIFKGTVHKRRRHQSQVKDELMKCHMCMYLQVKMLFVAGKVHMYNHLDILHSIFVP